MSLLNPAIMVTQREEDRKKATVSESVHVPRGSEDRESVICFLLPEVKRLETLTFCF